MIVVTGGAGFIGSNLVKKLNALGRTDILVVDDLSDGHKIKNMNDCHILDYLDKDDFLELIQLKDFDLPDMLADIPMDQSIDIEVIFHQGACSDTTEWNGKLVMNTNFNYTKSLLHYCQEHDIPLIYASSAAVYGNHETFKESIENEKPLNLYAYSKWQFDQYLRQTFDIDSDHDESTLSSQVVGLRYFNVYGPREQHKGKMASVAFHFNNQLKDNGVMRLFEGSGQYGNGEQERDFIYVGDVVNVMIWFWQHPDISGIFNVGTGRAESFNAVAKAVKDWHQTGSIEYIPFPENLKGNYQSYTQADISKLREVGYDQTFKSVAEGVKLYLDWLEKN